MNIDLKQFKGRLEAERKTLESELSSVGRINPSNPSDWEATPGDLNTTQADKNEIADQMEEFEERAAVETALEERLNEVGAALGRIEKNTYGKCKVCGGEIEEKRLEANPAAETCMEHMK